MPENVYLWSKKEAGKPKLVIQMMTALRRKTFENKIGSHGCSFNAKLPYFMSSLKVVVCTFNVSIKKIVLIFSHIFLQNIIGRGRFPALVEELRQFISLI